MWVLKRCRDEGLLPNNVINVRVRQPKSVGEFERYSIANCAVEAKFIREKEQNPEVEKESNIVRLDSITDNMLSEGIQNIVIHPDASDQNERIDSEIKSNTHESDDSDSDSDSVESKRAVRQNRFCFDDSSSSSDDTQEE